MTENLEDFIETHFSHNSAEEFLGFKGETPSMYDPIYLSVAYVDSKTERDRIHKTELELARIAIERRCKHVTNIDYCGPCIAATGLRRKQQ